MVLMAASLYVLAAASNASSQVDATPTPAFINSKPEVLRPVYEKLFEGGERDSVLNNMEIATVALKHDFSEEAAEAIDRALRDINRYYGQTKAAARARSLWYEEGQKEFKGEPYERAMAHYYRGMLDLRKGDYGNAQASFISGFLQDSFAEEEQNRSDFAILAFLAGWALERNGNAVRAEDWFKEAKAIRPHFERPPAHHDTLVVVETGKSPRKLADGIGHAELVYRRGKRIKDETVILNIDADYPVSLVEDIYFQAHTRGSRPVDRILEGKIAFRNSNEKSGESIANIGDIVGDVAYLSDSGDMGYVGSGLKALGALQIFSASNAKPRADTRYWSNLPDRVHIFTYAQSELGASDIEVRYLNKSQQEIPEMTTRAARIEASNGNGLIWVLSQN